MNYGHHVPRVYDYNDYKKFLRAIIKANAAQRGYQARLAEAAGCQKTYLSQVLHSKVQLTPDHALGLCRHWSFDDAATAYFLDLVHMERSVSRELHDYLQGRISRAQAEAADLASEFRKPSLARESDQLRYYSAWYWSAIHILTSCDGLWSTGKIATRLRLPIGLVQHCLEELATMGLVERRGDCWTSTQRDLHLPSESALTVMHHFNWRQRALNQLQEGERSGLHYTAVHALSREDVGRLRDVIRECIKQTRAIVAPSPEEELVGFTCDFFVV